MNQSDKTKPEVAIVILNWNGWEDTCECLSSLLESSYQNYRIVLIDNGSTDDSIRMIRLWANGNLPISVGPFHEKSNKYIVTMKEYTVENIQNWEKIENTINEDKLFFIKSIHNLGFAKGCNIGIRFALYSGFKYVLLLNNDTTLHRDCLYYLSEFIKKNPKYDVVTPKIYYYDRPDIIWYFGGKLTFTGRRKYYYFNKRESVKKGDECKEISFVSGCALFSRIEVFRKFGFFTEKYFFGEEDYEFSLRMKKNKVKMIAISHAKMYHKKGMANIKIFYEDRLPYAFIGYLNRFINKKTHCKMIFFWKLWRFINFSYIIPKLLIIEHYPLNRVIKFIRILIKTSNQYESVDRETFFQIKELIKI